jgi:uncharacterized protein
MSPALPASERLPLLDTVRGFALLGILIMNMPGFSTSFFIEADGSHFWKGELDRAAEQLRDALFSGKFNSMFSLLFGLGFTLQFQRMQALQPDGATALYLRRLIVLLAFGLLHVMVFWTGDVLHIYAVLGLVLVLVLRHASNRTLWILVVACLCWPALSGLLRLQLMTPEVVAMLTAKAKAWEASNNLAYGQGSFLDALREHAREFIDGYSNLWGLWGTFGFYVQMTTTMLLGVLAGRGRWPQRVAELLPQVRRLQWAALGLGLLCAATFTVIFELNRTPGPSPIKVLGSLAYTTSRVCLMVFYVLTLVRLMQLPAWQQRLAPVALAGRMPLTNYLMQTLICTTLFYGWGFGLWNRVGPAACLLLALVIFFAVQVPWSRWWLSRHAQGPLEALWARLTYGRHGRPAAAVPAAGG